MDEPADGGARDASNADATGGALCPRTESWPAGTYRLNALKYEVDSYDFVSPYYTWDEHYCSLEREPVTLTIAPAAYGECHWIEVGLVDPYDQRTPIGFCGDFEDHDTFIRLKEFLTCPTLPPYACGRVDIDRQTGAIIAFNYFEERHGPLYEWGLEFAVGGTGWPRCAATEAVPPAIPEPPAPANSTCGGLPGLSVGCTVHVELEQDGRLPACGASQYGSCTCEPLSAPNSGTFTKCCPPPG